MAVLIESKDTNYRVNQLFLSGFQISKASFLDYLIPLLQCKLPTQPILQAEAVNLASYTILTPSTVSFANLNSFVWVAAKRARKQAQKFHLSLFFF